MTKLLPSLLAALGLLLIDLPHHAVAQTAPVKQWDKTFGGILWDNLISVQQNNDGSYILGGYSYSPLGGDKTPQGKGEGDYWLVKLDANGTKQWDLSYGGRYHDRLITMQKTADGGYILGGYSVSPVSADKTQPSHGDNDYWVVKVDANGTKQWDKTFGTRSDDLLSSLQQTRDGGYILAGASDSNIDGDKTQPSQGSTDYWIIKLDANGDKEWDKTFGGVLWDNSPYVQQTADGSYILGGTSGSSVSGDKTQPARGFSNYWVIKLDATGSKQWDKTYGGNNNDKLKSLLLTRDGGYLLAGDSDSGIRGDKTQASRGKIDYWVVKVDANGAKEWDKTVGGNNDDKLNSVQQTVDGGYILAGDSDSGIGGDKIQASQGGTDYWVVKLDATGRKQWDGTYGGSKDEVWANVRQTQDESYILTGSSISGISGDKTQANQGFEDYWVVKLGPAPAPLAISSATPMAYLTAYPNPTTSIFTLRGPLGTSYQLLNRLGQVVRTGRVSTQPLDVQALPAGLYLLRNEISGCTTKLIKE